PLGATMEPGMSLNFAFMKFDGSANDARGSLRSDQYRDKEFSLPVSKILCHGTSPAVSGKPHRRLKHCTAWPLAPLTRLSSALRTMRRPVRGSSRQAISMTLVPATFLVSGSLDVSGSRRRTKGSFP